MRTLILSLLIAGSIASIPAVASTTDLSSDPQVFSQVAVDTTADNPPDATDSISGDNTTPPCDNDTVTTPNGDDEGAVSDDESDNSEGLSSGDDSLAVPSSPGK